MKFTNYLRHDSRHSENYLVESNISKEHGLTKDFSFRDLGLEGTELLDIAEKECDISSEIRKYKYVLFGEACLDFVENMNNDKKNVFYRTLYRDSVVGSFGIIYTQKNEIGLISDSVAVIFYNDESRVNTFVKSSSAKLYTKKTFTDYVVQNNEISVGPED